MTFLRRILSILLVLGLALGSTAQAAQVGMMVGMASMPEMAAAATDHSNMARCEGCVSSQDKGMEMAGCHSGICIVLPGLSPNLQASLSVTPDTFVSAGPTVPGGLSLPPDHRPPIHASLA
jgi:hypothetical protein